MKKTLATGMFGAIVAGMLALYGCTQSTEDKLTSADDLLAEGKYDQAKTMIDDIVKADSTAPDAIYGRGLLLQYRGLGWDAMLKYMEAAPKQNGYFPAMRAFLDIAIDLDYLANARKMAIILNERYPDDPEWYLKMARIDMLHYAFDDARKNLDQADSLGADRADMTLARAELAFRSYNTDSITQAIGRLMQVKLSDAAQFDYLASLYDYMNMLDSAVAAERRTASSAPRNVRYRLQLARYLFDQRHLHEAGDIVEKLLSETKDYGPAMVLDAYIKWARGDELGGDMQFLAFQEANKESPVPQEMNGDLYGYFGKTRPAQISWQSAYMHADGLNYPDDYLAQLYIKMENGFLEDHFLALAVDYFDEGRKLVGDLPQYYFLEAELKSLFPETSDTVRTRVDKDLQQHWSDQLWLELAGRYYFRLDRYDRAVYVYKRLMDLPYPKDIYVLNLLKVYETRKNWQAADSLAESLPLRFRGSRQIQEKLYDVYIASERPEQATRYAESLYHLSPGFMPYVKNLARLYETKNRIDDAHRLYTTYVSTYPDDPEGYYRLGHFELAHDMVNLVPDRYTKALAIDTGYAFAYELKGLYWQRKGDLDSAMHYYRKAISFQEPTAEAYHNLSEYYYKRGDSLDYAAGLAMAAARYFTDDRRGYLLLGNIYYSQKKYKLARLQYYKGMKLFPDDAEFEFLLGKTHFKLDEKAKAKEYLQDALKSGLGEPQRTEAEKLLAQL